MKNGKKKCHVSTIWQCLYRMNYWNNILKLMDILIVKRMGFQQRVLGLIMRRRHKLILIWRNSHIEDNSMKSNIPVKSAPETNLDKTFSL